MRLFRFGEYNNEKPALELNDGRKIDVSHYVNDYNEKFFVDGGLDYLHYIANNLADKCTLVPSDIRFGSPIARPSKIICIGLNYVNHAKETNSPLPKEPIIFLKATSALMGPNDQVIIPRDSQSTDWEVELAVVIGKKASYIEKENALEYIAGYTIHNDYSERDFQLRRGGQWVKGKSCDTFAPLGPYLVTADEIPHPHNLNLWLKVNGREFQKSNTQDMIFNIPFLIHYISQFMTLLPGDVISTGTPSGVGLGFNPPIYLHDGDIVELGIDHLGQQKQVAANYHLPN